MPEDGLEPSLPKEGDFKSPASTISPFGHKKVIQYFRMHFSKRVYHFTTPCKHEKRIRTFDIELNLVPGAGLEPARLSAGDFKSPVSTNSTIRG